MKLQSKVAVITGGSQGIGLGCARIFGKYGCKLVFGARGEEIGHAAEQELADAGIEALYVKTDVTQSVDLERLIDAALNRFGKLDCMVNNAGWHPPAETIDEVSVEDFDQLVRLNLTSTFAGCKFALPHLRKTRGNIINISSIVALLGQDRAVRYAATKAAQLGLTRALALDLAPEHVRVNAVCPAGVVTPLLRSWAASQFDPDEAMTRVDQLHPGGRSASIDEIGEVCAFLASDEASFITGQAICPDGGASLGFRR